MLNGFGHCHGGHQAFKTRKQYFSYFLLCYLNILVVNRQKSDALEISHIPDNVMSFLNFLERLNYLFSKTVSPLNVSHIDSVLPYVC